MGRHGNVRGAKKAGYQKPKVLNMLVIPRRSVVNHKFPHPKPIKGAVIANILHTPKGGKTRLDGGLGHYTNDGKFNLTHEFAIGYRKRVPRVVTYYRQLPKPRVYPSGEVFKRIKLKIDPKKLNKELEIHKESTPSEQMPWHRK